MCPFGIVSEQPAILIREKRTKKPFLFTVCEGVLQRDVHEEKWPLWRQLSDATLVSDDSHVPARRDDRRLHRWIHRWQTRQVCAQRILSDRCPYLNKTQRGTLEWTVLMIVPGHLMHSGPNIAECVLRDWCTVEGRNSAHWKTERSKKKFRFLDWTHESKRLYLVRV